jgi:hypothetical protein
MERFIKIITSLRLTVVCLAFGIILVWVGTVAQADEGLYQAQARYFKHWLVVGATMFGYEIPYLILPGGYLIGTVLLVNLVAAHIKRFQFTWKKLGIHVTHAGIILLLVGQLATDLLSRETQMRFAEGETRIYSESAQQNELVFLTDAANPKEDEVVAIPETLLRRGEVHHPKLPFALRVKEYHVNSRIRERGPMVDTGAPPATEGIGAKAVLTPVPETRSMEERNLPSAIVELTGAPGLTGTWLVSPLLDLQEFKVGDRRWRLGMRWSRAYHPFSVQLLKTTHEVYRGTDKPKNFQSRVRIENPDRKENREVDIYMNNPLRYEGLTFYQYQMGRDELDQNRGTSTLQVVRNPSWLTPYVGCLAVGGGLVIQFMLHLAGFISRRRKQ